LTLTVVLSLAACGGSSKSTSTSTAASPAATQTTPATTPTSGTTSSASSANAAVCAEAIKDLRPLQAAAAANNSSQLSAQAGKAAPKLIALQSRPGISPQTHAALGQLTGALEAFAHGGRSQAVATQLTSAGNKMAAACR
jgi:hypothetical protein